ncbi:hypothetical protein SARC_08145 [Sphaeroforma arctica JP610]|uniref:Uncharacterized protein n=1 Tax=Sphaeroforma arctica JP610 TaxID=667725 RepID=A0A0L0FRR8_9EUKA|nr:hypothetical protein SARC_08145 [Sphaeroforma arctica JP610]KNC79460.1 hypothetical protein SARC_08145 [Sphaeroforma arctica JP610]|eukprot:XP_014153362.1 hypothetical protein SARC_08145 [Sphaeroforma arctica JP610]
MAFHYGSFGKGAGPSALDACMGIEKKVPHIIFPGGETSTDKPATPRAPVRGASAPAKNSGFFAFLVNRPNRMPEMQQLFLKDMGAKAVHRMGPRDRQINLLCGFLSVVGTVAVVYQMGSMSLGINKKGK